jgi:hypothetical protein
MDSPATKRRDAEVKTRTDAELPTTTFLDLSNDIMLCILLGLNDLDGLNGLTLSSKRMASLLQNDDDIWRQLMLRRSWHPRWEFNYYSNNDESESADRWKREYIHALRKCIIVWRGFRAIKKWIQRKGDEWLYGELFRNVGTTPESHLVNFEREINHPLPNDLKEFMRCTIGFRHNMKTVAALHEILVDSDSLVGWINLLFLMPVADWTKSSTKSISGDEFPMIYDDDEISRDLPYEEEPHFEVDLDTQLSCV